MLIKLEIQLSVRRVLWLSHSFAHSLTHPTERHSEKVALFGVTVYSVLTPNRWWETGSSNDKQLQSIHSYKQSQFSCIQFKTQEFVVCSTTLTLYSNISALQLACTSHGDALHSYTTHSASVRLSVTIPMQAISCSFTTKVILPTWY
jgi:hypothetical protein